MWKFFIQGGELVTDRGRFPVVLLRQDITVEGGASFMVSPISPVMRGPSPGIAQDAVSQYEQSVSGQMRDPGGRLLKPASEQTTEECVQQAHDMYTSCMDAAASSFDACRINSVVSTAGIAAGCAVGVATLFVPAVLLCFGLWGILAMGGDAYCRASADSARTSCHNDYLCDLHACGVVIDER